MTYYEDGRIRFVNPKGGNNSSYRADTLAYQRIAGMLPLPWGLIYFYSRRSGYWYLVNRTDLQRRQQTATRRDGSRMYVGGGSWNSHVLLRVAPGMTIGELDEYTNIITDTEREMIEGYREEQHEKKITSKDASKRALII
jgi:hypothetical protein